jgi:hypothetical protein
MTAAAPPPQPAEPALDAALRTEIERQDVKHGRFSASTPLGYSRLAIACLEDEVTEVRDAWREERKSPHWNHTLEELLQVAAVAMRAYRDLSATTLPAERGDMQAVPVVTGAGTPEATPSVADALKASLRRPPLTDDLPETAITAADAFKSVYGQLMSIGGRLSDQQMADLRELDGMLAMAEHVMRGTPVGEGAHSTICGMILNAYASGRAAALPHLDTPASTLRDPAITDEAVDAAARFVHLAGGCSARCQHVPKRGSHVWNRAQQALDAALPYLDTPASERERILGIIDNPAMWPDPMGLWNTDQANAARTMKRHLRKLIIADVLDAGSPR